MAPLPDRSGRALPATADVVVIGGGYTGINAARELARAGSAVTLLEAHTLGFGASTRNGGIVHAGYKWGPRQLIKRYGEETGGALYRDTLEGYETVKRLIADEAIDCSFREVGHLELAFAASHMRDLRQQRESLASVGVATLVIPREKIRTEIGSDAYHGALVVPDSALVHPGRYFAGLVDAADRAGADLHEGVRARRIRRQADGRFVVETERGAVLARDVLVATNGYTDGVAPTLRRRIIPIGSYIIASEPLLRRSGRRHLAQGPGVLRHEELPVLLAHLGRPADGLRWTSQLHAVVGRTDRGDPVSRPAPRPSPDGRTADRLRLGWQRRVHLRPDAARRPHLGWHRLRDGLLRDRRGADDPSRDGDGEVAGGRRGTGPHEPEVPARAGPV